MKRDEWKLVTSESELSPGMCVELRPCRTTGKVERFYILGREQSETPCFDCGHCRGWKITLGDFASWCGRHGKSGARPSIRERRLYRLVIDDDAAETSETTVKRKEGVR